MENLIFLTKKEWDECNNYWEMLNLLEKRKEYQFYCNCLRCCWDSLDKEDKNLVEVIEKYFDSEASKKQVKKARSYLYGNNSKHPAKEAVYFFAKSFQDEVFPIISFNERIFKLNKRMDYPNMIREIFNPFYTKKYYSNQVKDFAESTYKTQDYIAYPILHDMLLDEGCNDEVLLNHLKEEQHLRGCWALEGLL